MTRLIPKQWQLARANPEGRRLLAQALNVTPFTAQILLNRGIASPEAALQFLKPSLKNLPDPFLLPDMEKAVLRLIAAIQKKERIAIYGDYDADGLTSTALLALFLRELEVEPILYIPDRVREGYGLHTKALQKLKAQGVSLVITVDCGSKSHEVLRDADNSDLDVIVTDHHEIDEEPLKAFAFVNPKRLGENGVGQELAGVGVVFFLLMALRQKMRRENCFQKPEPNLKQHLDLVALGTIADMAPLIGINRTLASFGLKELATTQKAGLIALKKIADLKLNTALFASDIGFRLAPRLNAGGRIAQASLGCDLLSATDPLRAEKIAKILDQCNQDRQVLQEKHLQEAFQLIALQENRFGLVVASQQWHPGIIGLVASKLTENFFRPSVAFSIEKDFAKGSARSIPGISIVETLKECEEFLEQFGGHSLAAGLTLRADQLTNFGNRFEEILKEKMSSGSFTPTLHIDCELNIKDIDEKLLEELSALQPFGIKNPEPVFWGRELQFSDMRLVGKNHLKLKISDRMSQPLEAIGFNLGNLHPMKLSRGDAAFIPQWNTYQDTKTIQLKIRDIQTKY